MKTKKHWLILLGMIALVLYSCQTKPPKPRAKLQLKNQTICTVAGVMAAGMDCAQTLTERVFPLSLEQTLLFMQPDPQVSRAGAVCMSARAFNDIKTSLDIICMTIGEDCTLEVRYQLQQLDEAMKSLNLK